MNINEMNEFIKYACAYDEWNRLLTWLIKDAHSIKRCNVGSFCLSSIKDEYWAKSRNWNIEKQSCLKIICKL